MEKKFRWISAASCIHFMVQKVVFSCTLTYLMPGCSTTTKANISSYHRSRKSFLLQHRNQAQMRRLSTWEEHPTFVVILELSNRCLRWSGDQWRHSLLMLPHCLLCVTRELRTNRLGITLTAQAAVEVAVGKSCRRSWTVMYPQVTPCGIHRPLSKTWHRPRKRLKEGWTQRCQIKGCQRVHNGCRAEGPTVPPPRLRSLVLTISRSLHLRQWEAAPLLMTSPYGLGLPSREVRVLWVAVSPPLRGMTTCLLSPDVLVLICRSLVVARTASQHILGNSILACHRVTHLDWRWERTGANSRPPRAAIQRSTNCCSD